MVGIPISLNGQEGYTLLASGASSDSFGGVFAFDGTRVERIDSLSTGGMVVIDGGTRLIRMLHTSEASGELLIYGVHGVERYYRIEGLIDPHDIKWDGQHIIAVSSITNTIQWIAADGSIARAWRAPGGLDSWHINCLFIKNGDIFVSAFGRYEQSRGWATNPQDATGVLFNLATGQDIITGLSQPHTPLLMDGIWLICNSARREVWQVRARDGTRERTIQLAGYTRGMAVSDHYLFIGESARRHDSSTDAMATIAIIDRCTWEVVGRFPVITREIYDLVLVPHPLLRGVNRGFNTNPQRMAEQNQYAFFQHVGIAPGRIWATGEPLPAGTWNVGIEAEIPATVAPATGMIVHCIVENHGGAYLVTAFPHPVHVSYRWIDPATGMPLAGMEGERTRLPHALAPGDQVQVPAWIEAPATEGEYLLRITLVQEQVAWFDDMAEGNACERLVRVTHLTDGVR